MNRGEGAGGATGGEWRSALYESYVSSGQAQFDGADPEAAFSGRSPWIRAVARRHLPEKRDLKILDLGCGHGGFLHVLRQMGYESVSGVDASPEQVEAAARLGVNGVKRGDALEHARSIERDSVDVVLTIDLVEHLTGQDLLELARETRRILSSNGRWILHVPNGEGLFGPGVRYGDLTHRRAFTPSSVRQLCRSTGFSHVEIHPDPPVIHGVASFARWCVWTLASMSLRVIFAAETGRFNPILTRNLLAVARP